MSEVWYKVEELIPAVNAIGGKPYWTQLDDSGMPYRTDHHGEAAAHVRRLLAEGRTVRLVKVTEEVIEVPDA